MRLIVIQHASDLHALSARLLGQPAGGNGRHELSPTTLEQLQRLNPHADLQRLQAGTVLLLPGTPELKDAADSQPLAGNSFEDFAARTREGLEAVAQRLRGGAEALAADRAGVTAVIKTAAVKRLIESDPLLKKQLDEAGSEFSNAQKQAQEASRQMEIFQTDLDVEFQILRKMVE